MREREGEGREGRACVLACVRACVRVRLCARAQRARRVRLCSVHVCKWARVQCVCVCGGREGEGESGER